MANIAQNDKKLCPSYLGTIHHMILIYGAPV